MEILYWAIAALVVLSAVYTGVCAVAASKFLEITARPRGRTIEESRKFQSEQENWDFSEYDAWDKKQFELPSFDGVTLRGEYVCNTANAALRRKVAIVCNGHTSNRIQSVKYATLFFRKGYDILLYDSRYFGLSDGDYCTLGQNETRDLSCVIDFAKQIFGSDCVIALHGESMGAATVLNVLSVRADDVDYVIADCPFSDTRKLFSELIRQRHLTVFPVLNFASFLAKHKYNYDFKSVSPVKAVENCNTPICFIHGAQDKFIVPEHSKAMFAKCKNPSCELHLFEGAAHARSHMTNRQLYTRTVFDFIDKTEQELKLNEPKAA
ncbi:MAG: alpha/beta hydrolase [Corallococcus sp.]|nr:alpha/beta hydrolase [Corallococcus sp.]